MKKVFAFILGLVTVVSLSLGGMSASVASTTRPHVYADDSSTYRPSIFGRWGATCDYDITYIGNGKWRLDEIREYRLSAMVDPCVKTGYSIVTSAESIKVIRWSWW